jgi:anti-sigma regulatory factor (Ser/Thr protein kinase)/anti-anti-sigma regulatory factor
LLPVLDATASRGFTEIVLDFRAVTRAYPDGVLPLICVLDQWRARGHRFRVLLPEEPMLRQLFLNANWAHYMDPLHPRLDMEHPQHLAARRYRTHAEQQEAVSAVLDVVLRTLDLRRDVIAALEWSVNEITDNVLNHAQSSAGGLVQLNTFREDHKITFVVADAGRGIPAAMRARFPKLTDAGAIDEAVKAGVTSIPESGQGNGLAGSLRIATYAQGSFKVASGSAQTSVFKDERSGKYKTMRGVPRGFRHPGTLVMLELSTVAEFDIGEALALDGTVMPVTDVVDLRYSDSEGDLVVRVHDEALGVGTRHAGLELRRKCTNLLNAEPMKRLVIDWSGVPLVSSSFADEAVGKLFVELGPTLFSARVGHVGAEPLVRSLLDRAVMQRVAQAMDTGSL